MIPSPKEPGPDHPIALMRRGQRVVVTRGGRTIADSVDTVILAEGSHAPVYYFPERDVAQGALRTSEHTSFCPYKGEASYFHLADDSSEDAAWSYREPFAAVMAIAGRIAFDPTRVDAIDVLPATIAEATGPSG